jgi:CAAX protease family protein
MRVHKPSHRIGLFLTLTVVFSAVFYAFIAATGHVGGGNGSYELGLMWSPAIAALVTCRFTGLPLGSLGWRWGPWRWQWMAVALPLGYVAIAYGGVWLAGFGGFPDPKFVATTRESLGWTGAPDWVVLIGYLLLSGSAGMVMSLAFALGEEIGWRGFLAPHMTRAFGFKIGAVVTGLVWTAWHLPLVFLADYHSGTPWWFGVTCFALLMVGMSVILAWLRMTSGSLWTAALFHASHNQFIQVFFTPATQAKGQITSYAVDEFGFALPLVVLLLASAFWKRGIKAIDRAET